MKYRLSLTYSQFLPNDFTMHPCMNTEDGVCLDISVNGFWGGRCEKTFLDVKVFNPHAPSKHSSSTQGIYRRHENMKKHSYEAWIREVEHGTFTPSIFQQLMGWQTRLMPFINTWLHSCQINGLIIMLLWWVGSDAACPSFSLLYSAIRCLRGSSSSIGSFGRPVLVTSVELVQAEVGLSSSNDWQVYL